MTAPAANAGAFSLVVFRLGQRRVAVELARVERVLPMLELARFPRAPAIVLGVFTLHGQLIPVVDIRRRFRLPSREPELSDHLLVVRTPARRFAFIVDCVECVAETDAMDPGDGFVPGLDHLRGIAQLPDGIVFVQDVDRFLSLEEEARLEEALAGSPGS